MCSCLPSGSHDCYLCTLPDLCDIGQSSGISALKPDGRVFVMLQKHFQVLCAKMNVGKQCMHAKNAFYSQSLCCNAVRLGMSDS